MIHQFIISSTPKMSQRYILTIDLVAKTFTYKNTTLVEEVFKKLSEQQFTEVTQILNQAKQINPTAYQGEVKVSNTFYWEFDFIDDKGNIVEIEGVNKIDDQVLDIFKQLETVIECPLGYREYIR